MTQPNPTLTPQQFVAEWQNTTLTERAAYQLHFLDLCRLVGHEAPSGSGIDSRGNIFAFEYGLKKDSGGQGFADVFYDGHFAIEYKAPGKYKDLRAAYQQLLQYREKLNNPPLLIVTDIQHWEIHTNWQSTEKKIYSFRHEEIANRPTLQQLLRDIFHAPEKLHPRRNTEQVTADAASVFKLIADNMRQWQAQPDRIAHFLTKLVFCLFAEDAGLLPPGPRGVVGVFSEIVEQTRREPERFQRYAAELFEAMANGGEVLFSKIPYFNGSLFDDIQVEELTYEALTELQKASHLNWESIEPAIFGTLFERSLDPAKRAQLGAHYTSREDILLIVEPVLMQPLRREWETIRAQAAAIRPKYDEALGTSNRRSITTYQSQLLALREQMLKRLRETTVLDPACGSGNFLYVSLQLLMDMEKAVINDDLFTGLPITFPEVHPRQMYGIERDPIAHALASIVVWIGYLQWQKNNGYIRYREPILEDLSDRIRLMDAIITYPTPQHDATIPTPQHDATVPTPQHDAQVPTPQPPPHFMERGSQVPTAEDGVTIPTPQHDATIPTPQPPPHFMERGSQEIPPLTPLPAQRGGAGGGEITEPDWPVVDVIVGNPPFLGGSKLRGELGGDYYEALTKLYAGRVPGFADLVCYWYEKARAQIAAGKTKRAGLLATNSIRGGANREVLKRIKDTGDIFMAWSDREWTLEGAAVRVSMVGFDDGTEAEKRLDGAPIADINPDLTGDVDITVAKQLPENADLVARGIETGGPFELTEGDISNLPQSSRPILVPTINANDITDRKRNIWIIDFEQTPEKRPDEYPEVYQLLRARWDSEINDPNRKRPPTFRDNWWQFRRSGEKLREMIKPLSRYICTPRVAKHRLFVWVEQPTIPDSATFVIARDDDYFFGVLHSKLHEVWALRMGTSLEDRPRYTPTTTFETFPFPFAPGTEDVDDPRVRAIADAARQLDAERSAWLAGLTPPPSPLPISQAVADAYGEGESIPLSMNAVSGEGLGEGSKDRTLTNLYNALVAYREMGDKARDMPKGIKLAAWEFAPRLAALHDALDAAVCAAYGWDVAVLGDEEELLRRLLALNLARASAAPGDL